MYAKQCLAGASEVYPHAPHAASDAAPCGPMRPNKPPPALPVISQLGRHIGPCYPLAR
jgi:hypothetical protein